MLDRGKPDDVMPGILGTKESLPQQPLSGMLNKHGGKVRLTFKLENDQVWIGKLQSLFIVLLIQHSFRNRKNYQYPKANSLRNVSILPFIYRYKRANRKATIEFHQKCC